MTKSELIEAVQRANKNLSKRAIGGVVGSTFSTLARGIKKRGSFCLSWLWDLLGEK